MIPLRVLIACERFGVVRDEFLARGHDAWSLDLAPCATGSNRHIRGDVRDHLNDGWDLLMVAHPPCTRLCNSGVRWLTNPPKNKTLPEMWADLAEGAALFSACWNAPIPRIAVENPVMHKHAKALITSYEPPAQTVQPWHFGDPAFKATSFYLRDLPPLRPTNRLTPPKAGTEAHKAWSMIHRMPPGPDRAMARSKTFPSMAAAIADQWGAYAREQQRAAA